MKKIFSLLAGGAIALSLSACGDSAKEESTPDKNNANSSEIVTDETPDVVNEESSKDDAPTEESVEKNNYADALKEMLPELSDDYAELSDESYNFIKENSDLFPANTDDDIKAAKERSEDIDWRLLNKNVKPYYSTITSYEGYVVQVEEEHYDNGETLAYVNVGDEEGNNHTFFMFKDTGDILEDDYVKFWGLPVGVFTYETLEGGSQNSQIFFGSHIEKVQ